MRDLTFAPLTMIAWYQLQLLTVPQLGLLQALLILLLESSSRTSGLLQGRSSFYRFT